MLQPVSPRTRAILADRLERAAAEGRLNLDHLQFCSVLWVLFPEDFAAPEVRAATHRPPPADPPPAVSTA